MNSSLQQDLKFDPINDILHSLAAGKMVILVDHPDRENEADLFFAAEFATQENINFMMKEARGLICLALTHVQVEKLQLPLMIPANKNSTKTGTAFTVSIEAAQGVSSGVSAKDRATTIRTAANPLALHNDIISPGHVFPLKAAKGGLMEREGHTEASVELCRLAGLQPAAVLCEILNEQGDTAKSSDIEQLRLKFNLKIASISELKVQGLKSPSSLWTAQLI